MKQIPLTRKDDAFFAYATINGSVVTEFQLSTGLSFACLSRETAEILFLRGKLVDADITSPSCYDNSSVKWMFVNIRQLSFGKVKVKNVRTLVTGRYGEKSSIGLSVLDQLKNYSITKDKLIVDDGNPDTVTVTGKVKVGKINKAIMKGYVKKSRQIREESGLEEYKFDYSKHIEEIIKPIWSCDEFLKDGKYEFVCEILEELQPIIKENLEDDEKHTEQKGAFATGYFYITLGTVYLHLGRYEDALTCLKKAELFTSFNIMVIAGIRSMLKQTYRALGTSKEGYPKAFAPGRTTTFEEDVQALNLQPVEFEDHYYGSGELKTAYIGFKDFDVAYSFCRLNQKRLEVLKKENGIWQRTGGIPTPNIKKGTNMSWHEQGMELAALDVEEIVTKRLADDVLAGKIIPCAMGQMPEDYMYLADKSRSLKIYSDDDYAANNDPDRNKDMGAFILYDKDFFVGYGFRTTYDDKVWRWECVDHSNEFGFPNEGVNLWENEDQRICYWQLNDAPKENGEGGIISPEAIK